MDSIFKITGGLPQRFRSMSSIASAFLVVGIIYGPASPVFAQGSGDLVVSPTRIVLEGRTRSASLSLVNRGSNTSTYRISVINMKMQENGQYTEITDPNEKGFFADKLIRYSPRRVVLEPGAFQAIRILLRKPADLAEGEYRSHIFIRGVPKDVQGRSIEQTAPKDNNVSIQLVPIYGVTLPIIVRNGNLDHNIDLSDIKLVTDEKSKESLLQLKLNRTGTSSSFGDIRVTHQVGGQETVIGELNKLAVYTPNKSRLVEVRLRVPDGINITSGTLNVTYKSPEADGRTIAQATHTIN